MGGSSPNSDFCVCVFLGFFYMFQKMKFFSDFFYFLTWQDPWDNQRMPHVIFYGNYICYEKNKQFLILLLIFTQNWGRVSDRSKMVYLLKLIQSLLYIIILRYSTDPVSNTGLTCYTLARHSPVIGAGFESILNAQITTIAFIRLSFVPQFCLKRKDQNRFWFNLYNYQYFHPLEVVDRELWIAVARHNFKWVKIKLYNVELWGSTEEILWSNDLDRSHLINMMTLAP